MSDFVNPGDPVRPRAATWNSMLEAAQFYSRKMKRGEAGDIRQNILTPSFVKVQNITGANVAAGEYLELGDFLLGAVNQGEAWFEADTYATGGLNIGVLTQALRDDDIGYAQVGGVVKATVNIVSTADGFVEPVNADRNLQSCENSPIPILYAPASTGDQECFILLGPLFFKPLVRFTLGGTLATSEASKAATITHQYGRGIDNSTSITVHNLLTSTASTYAFSGASGAAGLAYHDYGTNYRIIQLECP